MIQGKMLTDSLVSLLYYLGLYNKISYTFRKGAKVRSCNHASKTSEVKK